MKTSLIVAATEAEIKGLMSTQENRADVEFLVTGVGMVNTCFHLTKRLTEGGVNKVMNVGIAGAFDKTVELGDVVQVVEERFSEFGAQDNGAFLLADEMNLMPSGQLSFKTDIRLAALPEAKGITVNTIHGEKASIQEVADRFNPDVESMEGAAVAFVAQQFGVNWTEVRAISNHVEPRKRDGWKVGLAIRNLTEAVTKALLEE